MLDYSLISQKYLPFAKLADSVFNFLYSLWLSYLVCLLGGGLEYTFEMMRTGVEIMGCQKGERCHCSTVR